MIGFGNFVRIANLCASVHLSTLHGYFFHKDFWPNLNFLLEDQIKLVLIVTNFFPKNKQYVKIKLMQNETNLWSILW